jgi:hypothetical protein
MTDSVGTYFEAWNETDGVARRALLERCLTGDVELIDENGHFRGYDGLSALIAGFHEKVPGGRGRQVERHRPVRWNRSLLLGHS